MRAVIKNLEQWFIIAPQNKGRHLYESQAYGIKMKKKGVIYITFHYFCTFVKILQESMNMQFSLLALGKQHGTVFNDSRYNFRTYARTHMHT